MSYRSIESGAVAARQCNIARVDLRMIVQTTSATNFTARRCAVSIGEMCEEVQWGETTLMRVYLQWPDNRCSVYVRYSEQQCVMLTNAMM